MNTITQGSMGLLETTTNNFNLPPFYSGTKTPSAVAEMWFNGLHARIEEFDDFDDVNWTLTRRLVIRFGSTSFPMDQFATEDEIVEMHAAIYEHQERDENLYAKFLNTAFALHLAVNAKN